MKTLLYSITVFFLMLGAAFAQTPGEEKLRQALEETMSIAANATSSAALIEKVRPLVEKNMAFNVMTRRAIGPGWRSFTPEQQTQAIKLFTELSIRRYVGRFTIGEKPSVVYRTARMLGHGSMEVPTQFVYKGNRYEVVYRLDQGEGWRIADVVVEGVSFIANYRSQLDAQYQKGGVEGVLQSLKNAVENPR